MSTSDLALTVGPDLGPAIDALADRAGGRVGLPGVLAGLPHRARASRPRSTEAVVRGFRWGWREQLSPRWYPQGVTTSADAVEGGRVAGRSVVLSSAYARDGGRLPGALVGRGTGSRVTVADVTGDDVRYGHVLLVEVGSGGSGGSVVVSPLEVHAGGIAWRGDHLHVAATRRGVCTALLSDLLPASSGATDRLGVDGSGLAAHGYRWVLPVRRWHRPAPGAGTFRFSFLAVAADRTALRAGEYGRGRSSTRLAVLPLAADGSLGVGADGRVPVQVDAEAGPPGMQGAVDADGTLYVTTSAGRLGRGSLWVGAPGQLREHPQVLPPGPEDVSVDPAAGLLWTQTEHPLRRWVLALDRARL